MWGHLRPTCFQRMCILVFPVTKGCLKSKRAFSMFSAGWSLRPRTWSQEAEFWCQDKVPLIRTLKWRYLQGKCLSLCFLKKKLWTRWRLLSPDWEENFAWKQKRLRLGKVPTPKSTFRRKKKTFLQRSVKQACWGRFALKGLFAVFLKKSAGVLHWGLAGHWGNVNLRPFPEQVMAGTWDGISEPSLSVRQKKTSICGCWHKPLIPTRTLDGIYSFLIAVNFSRISLVSVPALSQCESSSHIEVSKSLSAFGNHSISILCWKCPGS